jgi:hypothetical protein
MSAHTPGPWVWRGKSGSLHQAGEKPHTYGATVLAPTYEHDSGLDTEISEADAALIAAAPDLVEALREMVRWFGNYPEYIPNPERSDEYEASVKAANAALAKAGVTP